jgi:hypothetical protein
MGTVGPFSRDKARPGFDANQSPPSSAELKNGELYHLSPLFLFSDYFLRLVTGNPPPPASMMAAVALIHTVISREKANYVCSFLRSCSPTTEIVFVNYTRHEWVWMPDLEGRNSGYALIPFDGTRKTITEGTKVKLHAFDRCNYIHAQTALS